MMSASPVSGRKVRRRLSSSEKYEMWMSIVTGQATQREAAERYGVEQLIGNAEASSQNTCSYHGFVYFVGRGARSGQIDFGGNIDQHVPLNKPVVILQVKNGEVDDTPAGFCRQGIDYQSSPWCNRYVDLPTS